MKRRAGVEHTTAERRSRRGSTAHRSLESAASAYDLHAGVSGGIPIRMAGLLMSTKGMKSFGRYGSVGFELLASIAVGYYLGHWLDGKLGTRWIAFVGFLLGCYAGFRALFRTAKQMQLDIERDEKLERGEDPWAEPDANEERELAVDENVSNLKDRIAGKAVDESRQ